MDTGLNNFLFQSVLAADTSLKLSASETLLYGQVEALMKEYYPHAKVSRMNSSLHIEYKVRNSENLYSGRSELAPEQGGVLADLEFELKPQGSLLSQSKTQNQYSYMVLQLEPFLPSEQQYLKARLCYAPDASAEFLLQFRSLLDEFVRQQSPGSTVGNEGKKSEQSSSSSSSSSSPSSSSSSSPSANSVKQTMITETPRHDSSTQKLVPAGNSAHPIFLWKATRGKEVVYLLGTIHIATSKFYPLATEIDDAFDQSKTLLVEVDINRHGPDRKTVEQLVKDFGTYKSPDCLSKHLSPGTRKIFDEYLIWAGETIDLYESYKPWYVVQLIAASAPRRGENLKIKSGLGLDRYFLKRASYDGTKVSELESIESQLHLHSGLSDDMQDKLLRVTLLEFKDSQSEISSIFDAWLAGDPERLDQIVNRSVHLHPELAPYMNRLLNQRNTTMTSKIDQLAKSASGALFVAVGAAHLLGETGLVSGLSKLGFDVKQLQARDAVASSDFSDSMVFGENRFKVWLPDAPQKRIDPKTKTVQYELADGDDKLYGVNILELGGDQSSWQAPGPLALDAISAAVIKRLHGTNVVRRSFNIQDVACRQIDLRIEPPAASSGKDSNSPQDVFFLSKKAGWFSGKAVRLRLYLVGTKVFVQLACGDKDFIDSPSMNKFMDSLKFIR